MPIYQVTTKIDDQNFHVRVVDAKTKTQAINHVTRNNVEAKTLTASEVVKLIQSGVAVETALPEATEEATNKDGLTAAELARGETEAVKEDEAA